MHKLIIYCLLLSAIGFTASCAFNSEEELYGDAALECDTLGMSFASDILPIFQESCNVAACHVAGGIAPGNFENYTVVKEKVDNGTMALRVLDLKDMPPMAPLTDCQMSKVSAWINDGAPEN